MRRIIALILFLPVVGLADDPFACVSQHVRDAFLPGHRAPVAYSTDLPIGFVEHRVPASLELVGSRVGEIQADVVYALREDAEGVVEDIAASIAEPGWVDLGESPGAPRGGFDMRPAHEYRQLCHDDGPKTLSIGQRKTQTATLITLGLRAHDGFRSCDALADRGRNEYRGRAMPADEMPTLRLPEDVHATTSGAGGGWDGYESRVTVSTGMSRASLVSLLNDQIRDQGWNLDSAWSGTRSSGSAWVKESEDGESMIGMLHAYGVNGKAYSLRFSIRLDRVSGQAGGASLGISLP